MHTSLYKCVQIREYTHTLHPSLIEHSLTPPKSCPTICSRIRIDIEHVGYKRNIVNAKVVH